MPELIDIDGIRFDYRYYPVAVRLIDREEFLALHSDDLDADERERTDEGILAWARKWLEPERGGQWEYDYDARDFLPVRVLENGGRF